MSNNNKMTGMVITSMLAKWLINWLNKERNATSQSWCDFNRLSLEIRPCDVLLVEGHSRASRLIKGLTQSIWTHSAIYIGTLEDIKSADLRDRILEFYPAKPDEQLLIEPLLGEGTIITPLSKYQHENVRICRPKGLSHDDMQHITRHVIDHLGVDYNIRQLLDLARFSFPYRFIPRRWRSSLFEYQTGIPKKTVCSSMIASAFATVQYPIHPIVQHEKDGGVRLYKRNIHMYVPRDFDTSPYFEILKYPFQNLDDPAFYRQLPWDNNGVICNKEGDCFVPTIPATVSETIDGSVAMFSEAPEQVFNE